VKQVSEVSEVILSGSYKKNVFIINETIDYLFDVY